MIDKLNNMVDWCLDNSAVSLSVIGLIFGLLIYFSVVEMQEWDKFKVEHHCVLVETRKGSIQTSTVLVNGKVGFVTSSNPDVNGFKCDDGVVYYR